MPVPHKPRQKYYQGGPRLKCSGYGPSLYRSAGDTPHQGEGCRINRPGCGHRNFRETPNNPTYILNEPRVGYRMPKGEMQEQGEPATD